MCRFLLLLLFISPLLASSSTKSLYSSLDPLSIAQHLAFYELYPDTREGKKALAHAWELLNQVSGQLHSPAFSLPPLDIQALISLITRQAHDPIIELTDAQLETIEKMGAKFANRRLLGHEATTIEELHRLPSEEIDLGRALLLNQLEDLQKVKQYEASLDLMALQIAVRLSPGASSEQKIREINRFIFEEMNFRFPPHSLYAHNIDLYTFLPSVLDSRQGVCLGVSILYLCLAQRLDLPLEIITPPGHIYLRYPAEGGVINIETTARGINLPSDTYLGINTRALQKRTLKEVIGLAFSNHAAVAWESEDHKTAVTLYEKALPYLPEDSLIKMFLGFNYLFTGQKERGKRLLTEICSFTFDDAVSPETMPDDYLNEKIDEEGIKAIFTHVDETRTSILKKQKKLQESLARYPHFRAGILQLAVTWLQLGRHKEALETLKKHHDIDSTSSIVEYYLAALCMQRWDYANAWLYLKNAEALTAMRDTNPKPLKELRAHLHLTSPEGIAKVIPKE